MAAKQKAETYRANTAGSCVDKDGNEYTFHKGDLVAGDHPLIKLVPSAFDLADDMVRFASPGAVEQATAAPGEKRA